MPSFVSWDHRDGTYSLNCEAHGRRKWRGDLICAACKRIYPGDVNGKTTAPVTCECGALMIPRKRKPFTARAICHECAEAFPAAATSGKS